MTALSRVPQAYLDERATQAVLAANYRRLSPRERMDRVGFNAGRAMKARIEGGGSDTHASAASGRSGAVALGFISNATKDTQQSRQFFQIDRDESRCKRMRLGVSNSARLLHRAAHVERGTQRWNLKFLTLTYAAVDGWRPGHLGAFRKTFDMWCKRNKVKCRFVWVAELQKRGAVHYHMVIWLPRGKFLPKVDSVGWWPHGSSNIQTAQNPVGYLMKYASKATAAEAAKYPRGCRMFGCGGLDKGGREEVRYWRAPIWVRDAMPGTADIRKVTGGYVDAHTGEFVRSEWAVIVGPDGSVWAFKINQSESMQ